VTSVAVALQPFEAAERAYMYGRGSWAKMSVHQRCKHIECFAYDLEKRTEEIAQLLMWEICKNVKDSKDEVTRTVAYIRTAIKEAKVMADSESTFQEVKGILCQIRHLPLGGCSCFISIQLSFE
jgi:glyceraldehyde-3-phosphate dehydrogenase (NADP+)